MSKNKISVSSNNSYAQALFELATESNALSEIEKQVNSILVLIKNSEDFSYLIKNPTTRIEDLVKVMEMISEKNNHNELLKRFISFIIKKRRFFYVEKIFKGFIDICSKSRGEITAKLSVAKELSNDEINNIKNDLSKNFGSEVKLNYTFDPSLIGGLIMQVESIMIDTSVKNKLQQIENKMIEA